MKGTIGPKIVLEYVDRPDKLADYYSQTYMALMYYNKTRCLVEKNRYRLISHFDEMGWKGLLCTPPQGLSKLVPVRSNVIGIHMNEDVKNYMKDILSDYIGDYCDLIPSRPLLQEFIEFGTRNTDRVFSFGLAVIMLKDDKRASKDELKRRIPTVRYKRIGGRIVRTI